MPLILTSDFPSTSSEAVAERIRQTASQPRVAWIPPSTITGRARFEVAEEVWRSIGIERLEYCDIDDAPSESQLADLSAYDVIYLTGGEPVGFRQALRRSGAADRLAECLAEGRLIVAASGGAMQLTTNVSLFRLVSESVDEVIGERHQYEALGLVEYEILPHVNTFEPAFLEKVRQYSGRISTDVLGLADGAALLCSSDRDYECVGPIVRFRAGTQTEIE